MLTEEDLCKLEELLGKDCANDVALDALLVEACGDPDGRGAAFLAETMDLKPREARRQLLEVARLAGALAELLSRENVRVRLVPWQLGMMDGGTQAHGHLDGPSAAAYSALGVLSDRLSYLSEGASHAAGKVPVRQGPRADARANLLAGNVAHHMRLHGLRVSSAEGSKFVRVLGNLWSPVGLSGDVREAAKRAVRNAQTAEQPKPAPETPSAAAGPESPPPSARAWWGGELPE
jgi:hypothetical protein